jgi:alpha-L-rhamnosidase
MKDPHFLLRNGGIVRVLIAPLLGMASMTALLAALPPGLPPEVSGRVEPCPMRSFYIQPSRLVWQSEAGVQNADNLLESHPGQALLSQPIPACTLNSRPAQTAGVLLDFGVQLNGYVEIFTPILPDKNVRKVRVRFGESVSEAMAELGAKHAQNDHAIRDQVVTLPWLGKITLGPSGFRFVRIDAEPGEVVSITQVRAVLVLRDIPYVGSFRSDDERLNRIWQAGAYTVHLNMQDYLWDGIKRDRLVWIGDMHPEVRTINAVFGHNDVVPRSLDLTRDVTPPTEWMNGISSYSMWWVLIHEDWWLLHGNREYLDAQKPYMTALLKRLATFVDDSGKEKLDGHRFLDWPSSENQPAVHAGLHALLVMTMNAGQRLMTTLGDSETALVCKLAAEKLGKHSPPPNESKQAAALLALAGLEDASQTARNVLLPGGAKNVSTFYGYYVLEALAQAGEFEPAMELIRTYWGAMLDHGATTFWEDFNIDWIEGAARIDELVPPGKKDLHADFGAYCYEGLRHSLCHGWASGPTAWLSEHVLGIKPLEPGCTRVLIAPNLGSLNWVEGSYPTPHGPIKVRHERGRNGKIKSSVQAPKQVKIQRAK